MKAALSIVSIRLVETLSPGEVFLFPSVFLGTFIKILQFLPWIFWGLVWLVTLSWSKIKLLSASELHSTFSVAHMYRGPYLLPWCQFMWRQKHVRGDLGLYDQFPI